MARKRWRAETVCNLVLWMAFEEKGRSVGLAYFLSNVSGASRLVSKRGRLWWVGGPSLSPRLLSLER